MDPGIPVPPPLYGGHERLVHLFAAEYARLGHQVSLLAGPDSSIDGKCYEFGINDLGRSKFQRTKELVQAWNFLNNRKNEFDLIHNFGRLLYLLPVLNHRVKKIMTYGRKVSARGIKIVNYLPNKNLCFTAASSFCASTGNVAGRWETVYNSIDFSSYELKDQVEEAAPLMFLGRLDKVKGPHIAINVAKKTGQKLWIGGNIPTTPDNLKYFNEEVQPHIDNEEIIYLGPLNDEQKNHYLGRSKALLFPTSGPEAFGLVLIEAMACGTPVISFDGAAMPEVVDENLTGFLVQDENSMIEALKNIPAISRSACREQARKRFDVQVIAENYLRIADSL